MAISTIDSTGLAPDGAWAPAGTVLQVVQMSVSLGQVSTSSSSFVDSGYYLNITPSSASSKILVFYNATVYNPTAYAYATIYRNNTTNLMASGNWDGIDGYQSWGKASFSFLDSPATTSQTKYSIYFGALGGGTMYMSHVGSSTPMTSQVSMTAMEIAG